MTVEQTRQLVRKVASRLKKDYSVPSVAVHREALDELLLGILATGSSERRANAALHALAEEYVDWNELRISSACDIAAALPEGDVPDALAVATMLRDVLNRVYEAASEMSLQSFKERPAQDAVKVFAGVRGFPEPALARAVVLALGREELPLTAGVAEVCRRLALVENDQEDKLTKLLPKGSLFEFHSLMYRHAQSVCLPDQPRCAQCHLCADCRTGRANTGASTTRRRSAASAKRKGS